MTQEITQTISWIIFPFSFFVHIN